MVIIAILAWCALSMLCVAPARAQIRLLREPAMLVPGRTAVVPVAFEGAADPRSPFAVRLTDGRVIPAEVHRLIAEPVEPGASPLQRWLGSPGRWSSSHNDRTPEPPPPGAWVAVIEVPADAAGGSLLLNQSRVPVVWVVPDRAAEVAPEAWSPVFDRAPDAGTLQGVASALARDPARRWRARLIASTLSPSQNEAQRVFADPVVEALASQTETLWQIGLAALWRADANEALLVRRRLGQFVSGPGGAFIPAWEPSASALLEALVDPAFGTAERVRAASVWRESLPGVRAWVVDDAGLSGERGPIATIAMTMLGPAAEPAWLIDAAGAGMTEPELLSPGRTSLARVESGSLAADRGASDRAGDPRPDARPTETWTARVGARAMELAVVPRALALAPPGLRTGPWFGDWTMRSWVRGRREQTPVIAEAVLRRGLSDPNEPSGVAWSLFVRVEGAQEPRVVRVWLGPRGSPRSVLRIDSDGRVVDEVRSTELVGGAPVAWVPGEVRAGVVGGGAWSCDVPIPPEAVGPDGTLRLGAEVVLGDGSRMSWPRAQFPWDSEPGRLAIRTSAWDDLPGVD